MRIEKWAHQVPKGIYKKSTPVERYRDAQAKAEEMVAWLNENNGKFTGALPTAYAISHCQVEADPLAFFVVHKEMIGNHKSKHGRNTYKNYFFPSQVIVNARILESVDKIKATVPRRNVQKKGMTVQAPIEFKEEMVSNKIGVPEACMSFPDRSNGKTMERFFRIKVRYQIPRRLLGVTYLRTITETVEGLKSHIFQHEIEHAAGKNMYYKN